MEEYKQGKYTIKHNEKKLTWTDVLCSKKYRISSIVGIFVAVAQPLSGIVVFEQFSDIIINKPTGKHNPYVGALLGFLMWIFSVLGIVSSSKFGRRTLLVNGYFCMAAS